jgi:hypothetical protein
MNPQRLADAGAESFRLNDDRHETMHLFHSACVARRDETRLASIARCAALRIVFPALDSIPDAFSPSHEPPD